MILLEKSFCKINLSKIRNISRKAALRLLKNRVHAFLSTPAQKWEDMCAVSKKIFISLIPYFSAPVEAVRLKKLH